MARPHPYVSYGKLNKYLRGMKDGKCRQTKGSRQKDKRDYGKGKYNAGRNKKILVSMSKKKSYIKKSKNFYFIILNLIKEHYYPAQIAKKLGITKQRLNYYIATLKRQGCIKKLSQGAWLYIKDYEPKRVKKINMGSYAHPTAKKDLLISEDNVRGHAFMFHLKLRHIPNWVNRIDYMIKKDIIYKPLKNKGQRILIKGRKVHLFDQSIIVYDKESYVAEKAKETKSLAIYEYLTIIKKIESLFNVSFMYRKKYQFKVIREHYALIKNSLARQYDKEGKKLQVYNHKGLWLLIDNSFNLHELETLKNREAEPEQAVYDNEGVQIYFNSHKTTGFKVTPEFVLDTLNGIQQNQLIFDQNMKSHLKVLDKIGTAIDELRKEIKNTR